MFVNINPDGNFTGTAYVYSKDNVEACQLKRGVTPPEFVVAPEGMTGLAAEIPYQSEDCGKIQPEEKLVNGSKQITNSREYIIQYDSNFKTALDHKVLVKCIITEGVTKVEGKVDQVQQGSSDYEDVNIDSDMNAQVVNFNLKSKDDKALAETVNLGDEIMLDFQMTKGTGYVDFVLTTCTANNTVNNGSSPDYKSLVFVSDNCPTKAGQALFKNGVVKSPEGPKISVSISAFMFSGDIAKIGFVCDIKLCRENNKEECKKKTCEGVTSEADEQEKAAAANETAPTGNNTVNNSTANNNNNANATNASSTNSTGNATESTGPSTNTTGDSATGNTNGTSTESTGPSTNTTAAAVNPPVVTNKRRKRSEDDREPVRHVYREVTVVDPLAPKEELKITVHEKDCMQDDDVITIIVLLACICFFLFFVALAFVLYAVCAKKSKQLYHDSPSAGYNTHILTGSSGGSSYNGSNFNSNSQDGRHYARAGVEQDSIGFSIPRLQMGGQGSHKQRESDMSYENYACTTST